MRTTLTFDQCEAVLLSRHYGHLGCSDDTIPYVFPVTYVYKNGYLYSHTYEGTKIDILRKNPQICLQVEFVKSGYEWESVMSHGVFEEVTDHAERHEIELMLADQYAAISLNEKVVPVSPVLTNLHRETIDVLKKSIVYRINVKQTTGIRETYEKTGE